MDSTPGFSSAYKHLADCLSYEGRFAEAFALADLLVARLPRCTTAYKLRGGLHAHLNRHPEALTDFETAAKLGPSDPATYFGIGESLRSVGKFEQALATYEEAKRLRFPPIFCDMGISQCRVRKAESSYELGVLQRPPQEIAGSRPYYGGQPYVLEICKM